MLTATDEVLGVKFMASEAQKDWGKFLCGCCSKEVVLKKGQIKIHHFAHKVTEHCSASEGETEQHWRAKQSIYEALLDRPGVSDVELEKALYTNRADVYAKIGNVRVAIEVQRSTLTPQKITERTTNYHRQGIAVLWIGLPPAGDFKALGSTQKYAPRAWESWAHAAYFGRVYFWTGGSILQPVHFDKYMLEKPHSEWYESGGEQRTAGGYAYASKRWVQIRHGPQVDIAVDFKRMFKAAFSGGKVSVPSCTLFMDKADKWW